MKKEDYKKTTTVNPLDGNVFCFLSIDTIKEVEI